MLNLKTELLNVYERIKGLEFNDITNLLLLRTVLEVLQYLDFSLLDFEKSDFKIKEEDCFKISIISKSGLYCPIYIEVLKNSTIDIQLGHGGEYLYLQPIENWNDLYKLKAALKDIFYNSIKETLFYRGDKLSKVIYSVPYVKDNKTSYQDYTIILSGGLSLKKKIKVYNEFKPWVV